MTARVVRQGRLLVRRFRRWLGRWRWPARTGFRSYTDAAEGGSQRSKTLWDWLVLLIVPVMLAGVGVYVANQNTAATERAASERAKADRDLAADQAREAALQVYLDTMEHLLLDNGLRTAQVDDNVRHVARARTLTVLRQLDGQRKGEAVRFLYESGLIGREGVDPVVILSGADLRGADLRGADLRGADLRGADLAAMHDLAVQDLDGAHLDGAVLSGADLSGADLSVQVLRGARLDGADLRGAYLGGADLSDAHLAGAHLAGAYLPGAILDRADLPGADLRGANLRGARGLTQDQVDATMSYHDALNLPAGVKPDTRPTPTPWALP